MWVIDLRPHELDMLRPIAALAEPLVHALVVQPGVQQIDIELPQVSARAKPIEPDATCDNTRAQHDIGPYAAATHPHLRLG